MDSHSPQGRRDAATTRRFDPRRDAAVEAEAGLALSELLLSNRGARPHLHVERAMAHALRSRWDRAAAVVRCAADFLLLDPALGLLAQRGAGSAEATDDLFAAAIDHAAESELFAALVQCAPVSDLRIERLLLTLRARLTACPPASAHEIRVAAMIATQARWVEYLWPDAAAPLHVADGASANTRALAALVDAMYRSPGAAGVPAIATMQHEHAIHELLALIRDEPAIEASYRRKLESSGFDTTLTPQDARGSRALRAATRTVDAPRARAVPAPVRELASGGRFESPRVLLIGCGDAREPVAAKSAWPNARITAVDWSATKLVHAMRTWECAPPSESSEAAVDFIVTDLLEIPERGIVYDVVQCTANAHYLPHPLAGCTAVARCTSAGSLLRLVIHSEGARRHLHALQAALEERGSVYGLPELRLIREELLAGCYGELPKQLLEHPDFFTASGMRRLLFAHDDDVPEPSGWIRLVESTGFTFVCVEANEMLRHAARTAGMHQCDHWSMRDWERFERNRPAMFGGEYSLWFVRTEEAD